MKIENNIFLSPSDKGLGLECIVNRKETVYLGNTSDEIAKKLFDINVDSVTYSSCMEFATDYGFENNDDAEKLFDKAWDKYKTMLKTAKTHATFTNFQNSFYGVS